MLQRLLYLLCLTQPLFGLAQPRPTERENADYWDARGQELMRSGQYAEAYTAFQLARGLGAPNMSARMELAKKRNINSIQLRALIAEARAQAGSDPTQSLRLLEYARQRFPDSTAILRAIGEVSNQPSNWYYTLRADSLTVSPRFTYVLADTDKCRLYRRTGDSLMLVHTFTERPRLRVFAADDTHLFVTTGKVQQGTLYALTGGPPTPVRTYGRAVTGAQFPAGYGHQWDYLLVEYSRSRRTLYRRNEVVLSDAYQWVSDCAFSPTGRYLTTAKALYRLTETGAQAVPLQVTVGEHIERFRHVWFSDQDQHLLTTQALQNQISTGATVQTALYRLPELAAESFTDSVRIERQLSAFRRNPRPLWSPFSPDGRYYTQNRQPDSSLFFYSNGQWQPVALTTTKRDTGEQDDRVQLRFSPGGRYVLVTFARASKPLRVCLYKLSGPAAQLLHEFTRKETGSDDVFSADDRYLLTRHTQPQADRLWRITADSLQLVHVFSRPLQPPTVFDADGYPKPGACFSPDGRYLLAYAATALTADSLWQLDGTVAKPIHAFGNRLRAEHTTFSPDERWLAVRTNGPQPATLWSLPMQQPLIAPDLTTATEALFSPGGSYLLADSTAWQVTDRTLQSVPQPTGFSTLQNTQFSPDDQYLAHTNFVTPTRRPLTKLYRVSPEGLQELSRTENDTLYYSLMETVVTMGGYRGGMFLPKGSRWLAALSPLKPTHLPQPDTLWTLAGNPTSAKATALGPINTRVDRQIITPSNRAERQQTWYVSPAALGSPDGRCLLTKEEGRMQFYALSTAMSAGTALPAATGSPFDVSAGGDYWLTRADFLNDYVADLPAHERYKVDYALPETPDTLRLWRRSAAGWRTMAMFSNLYGGMNLNWQGNRRQSWFSPRGNYLLLPTVGFTSLLALSGGALRPLARLNAQLLSAALSSPNPADGRDVALLYTDTEQQTYLLRYGGAGTRTTSLGFGTLEHPPRSLGRYVWWTRRIDASQQRVELLDVATGQTLVQMPFGTVLDVAIRPNGDAWVVSTAGARLVRSPDEVLRWLRQAPVAPLSPTLRLLYSFL